MGKIEVIEKEISNLNKHEFSQLRTWFYDLDNSQWDNQITDDIYNGKFDQLAREAIIEFKNGKTKEI